MKNALQGREVIFAESVGHAAPGDPPTVVALSIQRAGSSAPRVIRSRAEGAAWFGAVKHDAIVVCLDAESFGQCLLQLRLPLPRHLIDLGVEARMALNGWAPRSIGDTTLAMVRFGVQCAPLLDSPRIAAVSRRNTLTSTDEQELLSHLHVRMDCLSKLWDALDDLDLPAALLRGRFGKSVAKTALLGMPIDVPTVDALVENRKTLLTAAVAETKPAFGRFSFFTETPDGMAFNESLLVDVATNTPYWPVDEDGHVRLDNESIELMAAHARRELRGLAEARRRVDGLRFARIPIGRDGRHRFSQRPFTATTGRSQPLAREALAVQTTWRRHLIVPKAGRVGLAGDFASQELLIVAVASGDTGLQDVYRAPDPYIRMAQICGRAPAAATKESHGAIRKIFKVVSLAVQYGGGAAMIAALAGITKIEAAELLNLHQRKFPRFWAWTEAAVNDGLLTARMQSAFGWKRHVEAPVNTRSLQNFPAQANAGEILRFSAMGLSELGTDVIGTIHDCVMIEVDAADVEDGKAQLRQHMVKAGRIVLGDAGPDLKVKIDVIHPGMRWYQEDDKSAVWRWVVGQLGHVGFAVTNPRKPEGPSEADP